MFLGSTVLADVAKNREEFRYSRDEWFVQDVWILNKLGHCESEAASVYICLTQTSRAFLESKQE